MCSWSPSCNTYYYSLNLNMLQKTNFKPKIIIIVRESWAQNTLYYPSVFFLPTFRQSSTLKSSLLAEIEWGKCWGSLWCQMNQEKSPFPKQVHMEKCRSWKDVLFSHRGISHSLNTSTGIAFTISVRKKQVWTSTCICLLLNSKRQFAGMLLSVWRSITIEKEQTLSFHACLFTWHSTDIFWNRNFFLPSS